MKIKEIAEEKLLEYQLKDDGWYYHDTRIAYIMLSIEKIEQQYDIASGKSKNHYYIKGIDPDGNETKIVVVDSLGNFSTFKFFSCPDINVTGKEQKLIEEKLQAEASLRMFEQHTEQYICCYPGLQIYEGKLIFVLGDKYIGDIQQKGIRIHFPYDMLDISTTDIWDLVKQKNSPMDLMHGVSEIIFYYSLQAVVKPILYEIGIDTNYILAVVGPSGHLKTSMVKKMALWVRNMEKQQVSFSTSVRTAKILENMDMFSGMNFLIDDFHSYTRTQDIERQSKRLDDIVRHVEEKPQCANIIVTGEDIQGIFSCIDRMLIVHIPRMKASDLAELKVKLSGVENTYMVSIAYGFAKELLKNFETVKEDCINFFKNIVPDAQNGTRTKRHCSMLKLTEFLYRKYLCGGSEDLSGCKALEEALDKQCSIQQEELHKLSVHEQQDYVEEVMDMLESSNKYLLVEKNPDRYTDFTTTCCQKGDKIYITREALCYGMMKYCQRRVDINKIVRALENEGILQRDVDAITKKFKGKRHYVIYLPFVRIYRGVREKRYSEMFYNT